MTSLASRPRAESKARTRGLVLPTLPDTRVATGVRESDYADNLKPLKSVQESVKKAVSSRCQRRGADYHNS